MNQRLILIGLLYVAAISANIYGQNKTEKKTHPLIEEITNRNELSVNVAPVATWLFGDHNLPQNLCFSLGYQRNFGRNHYLRSGLKIVGESLPTQGNDYNVNTFYNTTHFDTSSAQSIPSFNDFASVGSVNEYKLNASIYIGYEHLFGRRRTRFLLGVDALAGVTYTNINMTLMGHYVTYNRDSMGLYSATVTGELNNNMSIESASFHFGFTPRIGVRYEVSKKIALTAVYCPIFYLQTTGYSYNAGDITLEYYSAPRMRLFVQPAVSELAIQIKM